MRVLPFGPSSCPWSPGGPPPRALMGAPEALLSPFWLQPFGGPPPGPGSPAHLVHSCVSLALPLLCLFLFLSPFPPVGQPNRVTLG